MIFFREAVLEFRLLPLRGPIRVNVAGIPVPFPVFPYNNKTSTEILIIPPVQFAADVAFLDGLALVVLFLTLGKGDKKLGVTVVGDEKFDGDDGEAGLLVLHEEMVQLAARQEKPAVTDGLMLPPGAPVVLGDVHAPDEKLVAHEKTIGILE